jgi:outer membrane cobalamin receptor
MNQKPWNWGYVSDGSYELHARAVRNMGNVTLNYNASRKVNIVGGAVYFADHATDLEGQGYFNGSNTYGMNNFAIFAQGLIKHRLANITIGARYEHNSRAGGAFVPRLALTKKIENFHFKVLYSQAFRSPALENQHLALTGKVIPEKSNVAELELGYQFTPEMHFSVNAFWLNTNNIIVYEYSTDANGDYSEGYQNYTRSGSHGIELVYSIRKKKWNANVNYSFAHANGNSTVDTYKVPQTNAQFAGMPLSKLVAVANYLITKNLTWNITGIYSSKRYAYTKYDVDGETPMATQLDPYFLLNSFINYQTHGFTIGAGAYDILNQKPVIPQAYNGFYAPTPGRSREYVIKLSYQLNFKK